MAVAGALGVATREGGVDRNTCGDKGEKDPSESPPARVAWIETVCTTWIASTMLVATREGGVDRNFRCQFHFKIHSAVATREGGVDRNSASLLQSLGGDTVATREGGVDRNRQGYGIC